MKNIQNKLNMLAFAMIALATLSITSCKKSSGSGITSIGGYDSSGQVAAANLIAYFPFDGNANDVKGGMTATVTGTITFPAGTKGEAYQGSAGTFATYTPSAAFSNLSSYSVSVWYNLPTEGTNPEGIFFVSGATNQDLIVNEIEPYNPVSGDSVRIHTGFNDLASTGFQLFIPETFDTAALAKWVHLVVTYDGSTSTYVVYQNGVASGTNSAFSNGQYITPNVLWQDAGMTTPLGNLGFTGDEPVSAIIGSWPDGLFGQTSAGDAFLGQLDELRVYNKALSISEVAGLYLNGKAGR
ncbi:MAG TPA: LamG-like jellyroll fold domain-containing protein [Ferruginibacter sp.]|jgi:hypothetical protein|nr:LamG-like jellyroll fold domain-containing protein [Ferruginibacter sp.]